MNSTTQDAIAIHTLQRQVADLQVEKEQLEAEVADAKAFAFNMIPDRTEADLRQSLDEQLDVVRDRLQVSVAEVRALREAAAPFVLRGDPRDKDVIRLRRLLAQRKDS